MNDANLSEANTLMSHYIQLKPVNSRTYIDVAETLAILIPAN